jgi:hypothetical protein
MNYKIINKKGDVNVVLIHGLFASSGFWLDYLYLFKNCKLVILEIDFFNSKSFKEYIISLEEIIKNELDNKVDYIFSHSLGTILANGLSDINFNHSFEICPVYNSSRVSKSEFVDKISEMTNLYYTRNFIESILSNIDFKISNYKNLIKYSNKRTLFYPNNDTYFNYNHNTFYTFDIFIGNHFDIHNAIISSFNFINNHFTK